MKVTGKEKFYVPSSLYPEDTFLEMSARDAPGFGFCHSTHEAGWILPIRCA